MLPVLFCSYHPWQGDGIGRRTGLKIRRSSLSMRVRPPPLLPTLPHTRPTMADPLAIDLCGIPLRAPVLAASGTFAYGVEFADILDLNAIGGFVVKGLSREPMPGN